MGNWYHSFSSAELYDPTARNWTNSNSMFVAVQGRRTSMLKNGSTLINNGDLNNKFPLNISVLNESSIETFTSSRDLGNPQSSQKIVVSRNERISVIGRENFTVTKDSQLH